MALAFDRLVALAIIAMAGVPAWIHCRPDDSADPRVAASQPEQPATVPSSQPAKSQPPSTLPASQPAVELGEPPPPIDIPVGGHGRLFDGWMQIDQSEDSAIRAWAEGRTMDDDALIIETQNVGRFHLDLGQIRLNWQRRILLRIDGFNRELSRPDRSRITYQKTATGGWEKVAE